MSKSGGPKNRRRLLTLWEQQKGNCHWCQQPMILLMRPQSIEHKHLRPFPNEATIDHLRSRYHPDRQKPNPQCEERLVAACWDCNKKRNDEEQAALPIEELHRRSGKENTNGAKCDNLPIQ